MQDGNALLSLRTSGLVFVATGSVCPHPGRGVHAFYRAPPPLWYQMPAHLAGASCIGRVARLTGGRGIAADSALFLA